MKRFNISISSNSSGVSRAELKALGAYVTAIADEPIAGQTPIGGLTFILSLLFLCPTCGHANGSWATECARCKAVLIPEATP